MDQEHPPTGWLTMSRHRIRDGRYVLDFDGDVLAAVTSERPDSPRWSELSVYKADGQILLHKVGRSRVAHTPDCWRVRPEMPSWLEAEEEGKIRRVPCSECRPIVGDQMDPHTRLEVQRYRVIRASSVDGLIRILTAGEARNPALVARLVSQLYSG